MRKELENRLVSLSLNIERLCKGLKAGFMAEHLSKQIIRSSSSAALNYGEAQAAESKNDFIHKISIVLKELRETRVWLLMIQQVGLIKPVTTLDALLQETNELTAIFVASLKTTAKGRDFRLDGSAYGTRL